MKQHGVLFTTENRLSVREDYKTMTRRIPANFKVVNAHPDSWELVEVRFYGERMLAEFNSKITDNSVMLAIPWSVGDDLYIKEPIGIDSEDIYYKDDHKSILSVGQQSKWIDDHWDDSKTSVSPLFMPKWAAREWLRVTAVKVERLQSIDEIDAQREGTPNYNHYPSGVSVEDYRRLWNSINRKNHPWERNEWVVAYTFERIKKG